MVRDGVRDDAESAVRLWKQATNRGEALELLKDTIRLSTSEDAAYIAAFVSVHLHDHSRANWLWFLENEL